MQMLEIIPSSAAMFKPQLQCGNHPWHPLTVPTIAVFLKMFQTPTIRFSPHSGFQVNFTHLTESVFSHHMGGFWYCGLIFRLIVGQ
jgi:hypothetical protein